MAKRKDILRKEGTQSLRCELTPDERADKTARMMSLMDEVDGITVEMKDQAAAYKKQLTSKTGAVSEIRDTLKHGELRDVTIETVYDFKQSVVTVVREDTGEEIARRPMNAMDRQMNLPVMEETETPAEQGAASAN